MERFSRLSPGFFYTSARFRAVHNPTISCTVRYRPANLFASLQSANESGLARKLGTPDLDVHQLQAATI